MKVTFEIDTNYDEDGPVLFRRIAAAEGMADALWEFDQWLRTEIKHNDKPYDEVREMFHKHLEEEGVNLYDIG